MIFIILFGASVFAIVFRQMGGDNLVHEFLTGLPGGAIGAMIVVMLIMFVLGFILDTFEIIFIVIPITAPVLLLLGLDPVWVGVMVGVNLQTSFLTPPFGFSLFYLRGVAPNRISTGMIYRGAIPSWSCRSWPSRCCSSSRASCSGCPRSSTEEPGFPTHNGKTAGACAPAVFVFQSLDQISKILLARPQVTHVGAFGARAQQTQRRRRSSRPSSWSADPDGPAARS
jgi:hypothetical protein